MLYLLCNLKKYACMKKIILFFAIAFYAIAFAQKSYTAKNGITYNIGDSITIKYPSHPDKFQSIFQKPRILSISPNEMTPFTSGVLGNKEIDIKYHPKLLIKKINLYKNKNGTTAMFECSIKDVKYSGTWLLSIDMAIDLKEIVDPNEKTTKEEALKLLEEKKKLLDLGVIKQDEFDKVKEELKPILLK